MKVASQRAMHRLEKHLVSPEGTLIIQTLVVYPNAQYHTLNQQYPIIPKLKIHQNQNSIFSKSLLWLKICLNHTTITSYTGYYTRYVKCALENTFFTQCNFYQNFEFYILYIACPAQPGMDHPFLSYRTSLAGLIKCLLTSLNPRSNKIFLTPEVI